MQPSTIRNITICVSVAWLVGAVYLIFIGFQWRWPIALSCLIPALALLIVGGNRGRFLDKALKKKMHNWSALKSYSLRFPLFRFVDVHRAMVDFVDGTRVLVEIESQHGVDLDTVLTGTFFDESMRVMNTGQRDLFEVAPKETEFLPLDLFRVLRKPDGSRPFLVRVRYVPDEGAAIVEYACDSEELSQELQEEFERRMLENSIYRGRVCRISFEDTYELYAGLSSRTALKFLTDARIAEGDIVLSEEIAGILERNVLDVFRRSEQLREHGLPLRRGLLFYGPPGTGKTFTCRYLFGRLNDVTCIVVAGTASGRLAEVFSMARSLMPCVIVLEDIDLWIPNREQAFDSTPLANLLDELDGFQANDRMVCILTTNAIERVESAIKDRPGRVGQCVHFGFPDEELRLRYLKRQSARFAHGDGVLEKVAGQTEGATQAFLTELVTRAAQIALELQESQESRSENGSSPVLSHEAFETARKEMLMGANASARGILGWRGDIL